MIAFIGIMILCVFIFIGLFALFVWSIVTGQMDDLTTPAERILWEDENVD